MENIFLAQIKEVLEIDNREILLSDIFRDFDEWDSLSRLSLIAMLDDEYEVDYSCPDRNGFIEAVEKSV